MQTTVSALMRLLAVIIGVTPSTLTFAQDGPTIPSTTAPTPTLSLPTNPTPKARPLEQPSADLPLVSAGLVDHHVGGSADCPDYWVVSTRTCIQHRRDGCPTCQFQYARRTPDQRLNAGTETDFRSWFRPGVPVCIVVHGSFVSPAGTLTDSHQTYKWLKRAAPHRPLQVVFFTWPSNKLTTVVVPQVDIAVLGKRSAFNGLHLTRMVTQIPKACPISFVGHSHGSRTVLAALHVLGGGNLQGYVLTKDVATGRRIRAIVAAAAVDRNWITPGGRYGRALCMTECLVNLRSRLDAPLLLYPLRAPFADLPLSQGLSRFNVARMGGSANKVTEFDVTHLVGVMHMWPNYYRRSEIAAVLMPYIHFD